MICYHSSVVATMFVAMAFAFGSASSVVSLPVLGEARASTVDPFDSQAQEILDEAQIEFGAVGANLTDTEKKPEEKKEAPLGKQLENIWDMGEKLSRLGTELQGFVAKKVPSLPKVNTTLREGKQSAAPMEAETTQVSLRREQPAISGPVEAAVAKFLGSRADDGAEEPGLRRQSTENVTAEAATEAEPQEGGLDPIEQAMETQMTDIMLGRLGATPMGGSVDQIKKLIEGSMVPKVTRAHDTDQHNLNKLADEIRKCGANRGLKSGDAKNQFNKYKFNSRRHKRCRANEAVRYGSKVGCTQNLKSLKKIKSLKCKAYATIARNYGDQNRNRAIVKKAGGEKTLSYVTRMTASVCGEKNANNGMLEKYLRARAGCMKATQAFKTKGRECKRKRRAYFTKKSQCNSFQTLMDGASCKRAILQKDICETYSACYQSSVKAFTAAEKRARVDEKDRKGEWRGLKRIECLIHSFADGQVSNGEVEKCKKKSHSTDHLSLKYPKVSPLVRCTVTNLYPATGAYKRAEFATLPALARGKESDQCSGFREASTTPAAGSPKSCKCRRIVMNGQYSAGPIVKCTNCLDVRRSKDRSSCPRGSKIFSPASRSDWATFLRSTGPLRAPNWIVDVTRPQNGCAGCTAKPMNSVKQDAWKTSDGSPWWLRSTKYSEPSGDYTANCYMDLWRSPFRAKSVTFNDGRCTYHSKSYYCQPEDIPRLPKAGSPAACKCSNVHLTGSYSAGALVKCEQCLPVSKSTQKNSCPAGMKIFSPRSRRDWKTFLSSAGPLRAPNWIIDVTRPQNGCGGCTKYPMKSTTNQQATWRTSDGSAWWLRSTRSSEPNGDYNANCFLNLFKPANENALRFNDARCRYYSRSYYCQPVLEKPKPKPKQPLA